MTNETAKVTNFCYERGIVEFVEHLNRASDALHSDVIHIVGEKDGTQYEIALQYSTEYTENVQSYVNNIHTIEGGTHVSGFRPRADANAEQLRQERKSVQGIAPGGDDFREGLTAVISVRVPHPQFEGQTKTKLGNSEVEGIVSGGVGERWAKYFEENPRVAKAIVRKGLLAAEAREAARKAKDLLRTERTCSVVAGLPGKLRDCISKNLESANCTWSKVIRPVDRPKVGGCANIRRSCRCVERSSTPTRAAKIRCWRTRKSNR